MPTTKRLAAVAMAGAASLAIAGFTALGSVFDYPEILKSPTAEILTAFRRHEAAVTGWFLVLVLSAALLAPIGWLLGRIAGGRLGPWISGIGIAAATVQVIGLSRWILFVPRISDDATQASRTTGAHHAFELLHTWLGEVLGETVGYALTASFTVLVVLAVTRHIAPRWMTAVGYTSAALIATGIVIPLGLEWAALTNFAGYVAWCLWLIAMAVTLWRSNTVTTTSAPLMPEPDLVASAS